MGSEVLGACRVVPPAVGGGRVERIRPGGDIPVEGIPLQEEGIHLQEEGIHLQEEGNPQEEVHTQLEREEGNLLGLLLDMWQVHTAN